MASPEALYIIYVLVNPSLNPQPQDFSGGPGLRIHLPMQGTQVRALVREDPTCHRASKPVRHNY